MTLLSRRTVSLGLTLWAGLFLTSHVSAQAPLVADQPLLSLPDNSLDASTVSPEAVSPEAVVPITDVALSADGVIRGRVLSANGKPIDGTQVVIRQGPEVVRKMMTDKQGQFTASGMGAGVYTIATVQGSGLYRLWPQNIAPPTASQQALLMSQEPVVRAQFGGGNLTDWATIGLGAAGLTVGLISLDKINDLEGDVKRLQSP